MSNSDDRQEDILAFLTHARLRDEAKDGTEPHGLRTTRDVADALQISLPEARRQLAHMSDNSVLVRYAPIFGNVGFWSVLPDHGILDTVYVVIAQHPTVPGAHVATFGKHDAAVAHAVAKIQALVDEARAAGNTPADWPTAPVSSADWEEWPERLTMFHDSACGVEIVESPFTA